MEGALLVVVRHGRTAWNVEGRFQGWADPPLDDVGRSQLPGAADAVAADLEARPARPVALCSSDSRRALDTAVAVAGRLGLEVTVDAGLREVDVGHWEGLTRPEIQERFPEEYARWAAGQDIRRGGGETRAECGRRVAERIVAHLTGVTGALVVVGHGVSLQAALAELRARGCIDLESDPPHLGNACHLVIPVLATAPRPVPG